MEGVYVGIILNHGTAAYSVYDFENIGIISYTTYDFTSISQ